MFTLLESKSEIAAAHETLVATIKKNFKKMATRNIGYPSGTEYDAEVFTNGKYWFWSGDLKKGEAANPRSLHWFGVFDDSKSLQITVEINTPYVGANGRVAGFFARRIQDGSIYLCHSGGVAGGTEGVGKEAFLAWSNAQLVPVKDSRDRERLGVVVMPILGAGSTTAASRYVDTIAKFKVAVRNGELDTPQFQNLLASWQDFYSEPSGRRKGQRGHRIDYFSRHGDVVDALADWRSDKGLGATSRLVKNVNIDLGVEVDGHLLELYEVKTSSDRTDIYTAIGQLIVHSQHSQCKKFLVIPSSQSLAEDIVHALSAIDIETIEFELTESEAWIV